ncbi:MAG: hypothetical protein QOJ99_3404 [Bryobacterales bacterium]|jgi:hypothetical protein|nr:hypothetical protein [Bryobacterales bacterium]
MKMAAVLLMVAGALLAMAQVSPGGSSVTGKEVLDYEIEWRLIPAGSAKLTLSALPRPASGGNQASSEVRLHVESAGLVSRLFRVSDDYTAMEGQNFCTQSTLLLAHEGNRNKETRVLFDAQNRKATWTERDFVKNATNTQAADIPSCVHDVLGGLMVLRSLRLEPGKTAGMPLSDGKKSVQVKVESQRREELKTALGTFKTIRYEAFLFDNVLYKRAGHLHVWLTDDDRRLPVQLQVRLQFTIGTITFRLVKEEK